MVSNRCRKSPKNVFTLFFVSLGFWSPNTITSTEYYREKNEKKNEKYFFSKNILKIFLENIFENWFLRLSDLSSGCCVCSIDKSTFIVESDCTMFLWNVRNSLKNSVVVGHVPTNCVEDGWGHGEDLLKVWGVLWGVPHYLLDRGGQRAIL